MNLRSSRPGVSHRVKSRRGRNPVNNIKFGAWNVRTMAYTTKLKKGLLQVQGGGLGKEEELCNELAQKNINVAAISEHRWKGCRVKSHGEHTFLFSGVDESCTDHRKYHGVAIVLDGKTKADWERSGSEVKHVSERLMVMRFKRKAEWFRVIAVYAPTYGAEVEDKDI